MPRERHARRPGAQRTMSGTMSPAYSRAAPAPPDVPSSHTSAQVAATSASSSRAARNAVGSAAAACPANASAAPRASSRSSRPPTWRASRSPAGMPCVVSAHSLHCNKVQKLSARVALQTPAPRRAPAHAAAGRPSGTRRGRLPACKVVEEGSRCVKRKCLLQKSWNGTAAPRAASASGMLLMS